MLLVTVMDDIFVIVLFHRVDAALEKIGSADDFEDTWASWVLASSERNAPC